MSLKREVGDYFVSVVGFHSNVINQSEVRVGGQLVGVYSVPGFVNVEPEWAEAVLEHRGDK